MRYIINAIRSEGMYTPIDFLKTGINIQWYTYIPYETFPILTRIADERIRFMILSAELLQVNTINMNETIPIIEYDQACA